MTLTRSCRVHLCYPQNPSIQPNKIGVNCTQLWVISEREFHFQPYWYRIVVRLLLYRSGGNMRWTLLKWLCQNVCFGLQSFGLFCFCCVCWVVVYTMVGGQTFMCIKDSWPAVTSPPSRYSTRNTSFCRISDCVYTALTVAICTVIPPPRTIFLKWIGTRIPITANSVI